MPPLKSHRMMRVRDLAIAGVIAAGCAYTNGGAIAGGRSEDPMNATGQSAKTSGSGQTSPGNPAQGDKPLSPGDQPAKEGTNPSSPVHNIDQKDLTGKKHE